MGIEEQNTELMQKVQTEINKMESVMFFHYVQLNEENVVVGVSELSGEVPNADEQIGRAHV